MSFTLLRYKDGKEIPIKVSILDAFHSAPPRRPKPVQLEKKPEPKSSPAKTSTCPKSAADNNANKDSINAKDHSDHKEETFTAKDNAKIVAMKAIPGTSWNDIKEAIGKSSVSQLKDHFKLHLGPNAEAEQKKLAEKIAKTEKNKAERLAKQAEEGEKKAGGEGGGDDTGGGNKEKEGGGGGPGADECGKNKGKPKAEAQEKIKENKDTPHSLTKQNLQSFVKKYEREKWLAAASRHYDLTGQRISPEAAKKMAEQN